MARVVFTVFFWIWGAIGFLVCTVNYVSLSGSVGVGTSTYMALGFLYWLGGMVLFGLGALTARDDSASALVVDANLRSSADEVPIEAPPTAAVQQATTELAVEVPPNTEQQSENANVLERAISIGQGSAFSLERVGFFIVVFLLTMLVVYALMLRK
jgi:hypothetical protein